VIGHVTEIGHVLGTVLRCGGSIISLTVSSALVTVVCSRLIVLLAGRSSQLAVESTSLKDTPAAAAKAFCSAARLIFPTTVEHRSLKTSFAVACTVVACTAHTTKSKGLNRIYNAGEGVCAFWTVYFGALHPPPQDTHPPTHTSSCTIAVATCSEKHVREHPVGPAFGSQPDPQRDAGSPVHKSGVGSPTSHPARQSSAQDGEA
jgi:hypothetical protein